MLTGLWTPKGGSGTTVTACAIARLSDSALIIDTVGDVPAVLGLAETDTPGVGPRGHRSLCSDHGR